MEKGADLERRVGRMEFADGALVRLRWPVIQAFDGDRQVVTDVDVFSLDFDARLRSVLSIMECKSVRGRTGEQDRLLWLSGLRTFLRADRAVLVRESTSNAGRDIARRLGVQLIGTADLEWREAEQVWLPHSFGLLGSPSHTGRYRLALDQLKEIGDLPSGLTSFIRYQGLITEPYRTLGALSTLADVIRSGTVLPEPAGSLVAADALIALILAALRAAGRLDVLGVDGLRREIEDGLRTGDPHDRQVFRVVELADVVLHQQLTDLHRAYVQQGASPVEWKVESLRDAVYQTPAWLPRFYDLAERYRRLPNIARQLPQTADLVLYDAVFGGDAWRAPAFDHLFTFQHRQVLLIALDTLYAIAPNLSVRLDHIRQLPFDRQPPAVPDRHAVYGDLSPRNVVVSADQPYLIDFAEGRKNNTDQD